MMQKNGYTLIELVVTVSLLVIVLTGGTAIFYRSFRSSGMSDVKSAAEVSLSSLGEMIESTLRYGVVTRMVALNGEDLDRADCLAAGDVGSRVTGNSLVLRDASGGTVIYSLANGQVSSNSSVISNSVVEITKMEFAWYCRSGVSDRMNLSLEAVYGGSTSGATEYSLEKDISLFNSGIN